MNFTKQPKTETRTKHPIDNTEFVKAWMKYDNADDIARHFNRSKQTVYSKANSLRKKGVQLPELTRQVSETEQLNKLIKKLSK